MFSISCGWLKYAPHAKFQLPRIVQVTQREPVGPHTTDNSVETIWSDQPVKVPLCDKSGHVKWTRRLYRLEWPGELPEGHGPKAGHWDMIPASILGNLKGFEHMKRWAKEPAPDGTFYSLAMILKENGDTLPEELPLEIAYHLAVNKDFYYPEPKLETNRPTIAELEEILKGTVRHPVAGLPAERVAQVLDARFALDQHALDTLAHLKWQAESWFHNPHITGFDTMIREGLYKICWTIVQRYFWLLGDYIYDSEKKYWQKAEWKYHWWQMAGYLFWTGRTGGGVIDKLAGMPSTEDRSVENFEKTCPDVRARIEAWASEVPTKALSHVTGKVPGYSDEPAVGPSLGG